MNNHKSYSSYLPSYDDAISFAKSLARLGIESIVNPYDMRFYYGDDTKPVFELIITL